jgi:hypothetical protein
MKKILSAFLLLYFALSFSQEKKTDVLAGHSEFQKT